MKTNNILAKENMKLLAEKENMVLRIKELERLNNRYSQIAVASEEKIEEFKKLSIKSEKKATDYGIQVDCLRSFLYRASQMERNIEVRETCKGKIQIVTLPKIRFSHAYGENFIKTETVEMMEF